MKQVKSVFVNDHLTTVVLACICMLILGMSTWSSMSVASQSSKRVKLFEKDTFVPHEPIQFLDIKAANKLVKFKEGFEAGDDWLKNATFKLKNISGKEIVFVQLDINFPETKVSGSEVSYRTSIGRKPGRDNDYSQPLSFLPDAEFNFMLDDKKYEELKQFVETRQSLVNLGKAYVRIGFVVFADGTAWSAGSFYRQNPDNPKQYIPISNQHDKFQ